MLAAVPDHHSCGSCSDQSGFGVWRDSAVVAVATTFPFSSIRSALAPVVETSTPRNSRPMVWLLRNRRGQVVNVEFDP